MYPLATMNEATTTCESILSVQLGKYTAYRVLIKSPLDFSLPRSAVFRRTQILVKPTKYHFFFTFTLI